MKKPAVFLIRISDNPISMWFAGRSYESWYNAGFTDIQIIEAITPETMHDCGIDIKFAPIKSFGKYQRPFSDTEKCIFYSHAKALKIIQRKTNPGIILEHDAELIEPLSDDVYKYDITSLGSIRHVNGKFGQTPALSYLITPKISKMLYKHLTTITCHGNVDAYINEFMVKYGTQLKHINHVNHMKDETIGNTIVHPIGHQKK